MHAMAEQITAEDMRSAGNVVRMFCIRGMVSKFISNKLFLSVYRISRHSKLLGFFNNLRLYVRKKKIHNN